MQGHHLVDQLLGRMARGKRFVEVANVGLGVAENGGRVVIECVWALVACDDDLGLERLDLLDARNPLHPLLVVGLCQPLVDAVVGDVAADDGIQARDVDDRGDAGVRLADGDDAQLVAFQVDRVAVEGIGHDRVLGNLTREDRVPELHQVRAELPLCFGNDGRRGDGSGVGERVEDCVSGRRSDPHGRG